MESALQVRDFIHDFKSLIVVVDAMSVSDQLVATFLEIPALTLKPRNEPEGQLVLCCNDNHFLFQLFHTDDYELLVLQKNCCPFCRKPAQHL